MNFKKSCWIKCPLSPQNLSQRKPKVTIYMNVQSWWTNISWMWLSTDIGSRPAALWAVPRTLPVGCCREGPRRDAGITTRFRARHLLFPGVYSRQRYDHKTSKEDFSGCSRGHGERMIGKGLRSGHLWCMNFNFKLTKCSPYKHHITQGHPNRTFVRVPQKAERACW